MCTDVDRNDKARVCVPGTVRVIGRRQIEMYSRLIHTVDHIEGRLRPGFDALDAFLTHMWAVTVTGAPKTWAMQFIEDHEQTPRRWYGGAVGKIGFDGSMNTGLTLRTAHITGGIAAVRAGATLLYDSIPEAEEARDPHQGPGAAGDPGRGRPAARGGASPAPAPPARRPGARRARAGGRGLRVLLVDHQDSFVHTLGDYFRQHGAEVTTLRFGFSPALLDSYAPDLVVLSPGPGRPADFGCAALLDEVYARGLPAFGVCLGLQAMVEHAGGVLSLLPEPAHGKPGLVRVAGGALLAGLPAEFTAGRYHSLYAPADQVRGDFTVTAATPDGVVMAIEDEQAGRWAVQFHPESILTASGRAGSPGHRQRPGPVPGPGRRRLLTGLPGSGTGSRAGRHGARPGGAVTTARSVHVVITNDDGIGSEGLRVLARAAVQAGWDVVVAAPERQASGSGAAMTTEQAGGRVIAERHTLPGLETVPAYAVQAPLRSSRTPRCAAPSGRARITCCPGSTSGRTPAIWCCTPEPWERR